MPPSDQDRECELPIRTALAITGNYTGSIPIYLRAR